MDTVIKIISIGIISLFLMLFIEKQNTTAALAIVIITTAFILGLASSAINMVFRFMRDLSQYASISPELIVLLFKTMGIAIITKLASDLCKDKGSGALSTCIELSGCVIALTFSFPILMSVIKLISSI